MAYYYRYKSHNKGSVTPYLTAINRGFFCSLSSCKNNPKYNQTVALPETNSSHLTIPWASTTIKIMVDPISMIKTLR